MMGAGAPPADRQRAQLRDVARFLIREIVFCASRYIPDLYVPLARAGTTVFPSEPHFTSSSRTCLSRSPPSRPLSWPLSGTNRVPIKNGPGAKEACGLRPRSRRGSWRARSMCVGVFFTKSRPIRNAPKCWWPKTRRLAKRTRRFQGDSQLVQRENPGIRKDGTIRRRGSLSIAKASSLPLAGSGVTAEMRGRAVGKTSPIATIFTAKVKISTRRRPGQDRRRGCGSPGRRGHGKHLAP